MPLMAGHHIIAMNAMAEERKFIYAELIFNIFPQASQPTNQPASKQLN